MLPLLLVAHTAAAARSRASRARSNDQGVEETLVLLLEGGGAILRDRGSWRASFLLEQKRPGSWSKSWKKEKKYIKKARARPLQSLFFFDRKNQKKSKPLSLSL